MRRYLHNNVGCGRLTVRGDRRTRGCTFSRPKERVQKVVRCLTERGARQLSGEREGRKDRRTHRDEQTDRRRKRTGACNWLKEAAVVALVVERDRLKERKRRAVAI